MTTATAPAAPARNLELKVRVDPPVLAVIETRLAAAGVPLAPSRQVDTYFAVPRGRLKLRWTDPADGEPAVELIAYARPDVDGPRWSAYHRASVPVAEASALAAALTTTLGVLVVVAKTRRVGLIGRTRVHLDEVDGLGTFVELETVIGEGPDGGADAELTGIAARLGLAPGGGNVVAGSYAELLLAAGAVRGEIARENGPIRGAGREGKG